MAVKENKTPKGKELVIKPDGRGFFEISFTSGGELPGELCGIFSDPTRAQIAINIYLGRKEQEELNKTSDAKHKE